MKPSCNPVSAQQAGIFTALRWPKATTPRREDLLNLVDRSVAWLDLETALRPHYQADVRKTGRKGHSLRMMVRLRVVQLLWRASDRQVEHALLDSHCLAKFCGLDPWAPRPPSASALRAFRDLLRATEIDIGTSADDLIELRLNGDLRNAGFEFRPGRIEDPVLRRCST